jgi:hypothetical protein
MEDKRDDGEQKPKLVKHQAFPTDQVNAKSLTFISGNIN